MTTVLIPGSFDPIHLGHVDIVEQSVELFGDVVVGVLYNYDKPSGSVHAGRTCRAGRRQPRRPAHRCESTSSTGLAVQAAAAAGADFIVKGLRNPVDFDIEQQMAHMNHAAAGVRTVFLPCRPDVGFVSSRFIREIASHGGVVDHLVPKPVAVALADRFGASQ